MDVCIMANIIKINNTDKDSKDNLNKLLRKAIQSGNLNFIIGSGASMPAINIAGGIEQQIYDLFEKDDEEKAYELIFKFLTDLQVPNKALISDTPPPQNEGESLPDYTARIADIKKTLDCYISFIECIENILNQRKTNILPKQANIFTTNYDVFFEKASEKFSAIKLNDGFTRTPNLNGKNVFASQNFFNSLYNNGNLYGYKVEIPTINLIKIHGSLTWKKIDNEIKFDTSAPEPSVALVGIEKNKEFSSKFALIIPQKGKFRETIMDRTFYDLLRIYANELDKENTLLIAYGFSFSDEHIFDITKRALKNPTLKLMIFAFDNASVTAFATKFNGYGNVDIIAPEDGEVNDFTNLNEILSSLPGFQE